MVTAGQQGRDDAGDVDRRRGGQWPSDAIGDLAGGRQRKRSDGKLGGLYGARPSPYSASAAAAAVASAASARIRHRTRIARFGGVAATDLYSSAQCHKDKSSLTHASLLWLERRHASTIDAALG